MLRHRLTILCFKFIDLIGGYTLLMTKQCSTFTANNGSLCKVTRFVIWYSNTLSLKGFSDQEVKVHTVSFSFRVLTSFLDDITAHFVHGPPILCYQKYLDRLTLCTIVILSHWSQILCMQ